MGFASYLEDIQKRLDDFIHITQSMLSSKRLESSYQATEISEYQRLLEKIKQEVEIAQRKLSQSLEIANQPGVDIALELLQATERNSILSKNIELYKQMLGQEKEKLDHHIQREHGRRLNAVILRSKTLQALRQCQAELGSVQKLYSEERRSRDKLEAQLKQELEHKDALIMSRLAVKRQQLDIAEQRIRQEKEEMEITKALLRTYVVLPKNNKSDLVKNNRKTGWLIQREGLNYFVLDSTSYSLYVCRIQDTKREDFEKLKALTNRTRYPYVSYVPARNNGRDVAASLMLISNRVYLDYGILFVCSKRRRICQGYA